MAADLFKVDKFRSVLWRIFKTKGNTSDKINLISHLKGEEADSKSLSHQVSFIENCIKNSVLPLPLLKKLKNKKFVLENYQMNSNTAKALGKSLPYLGDEINSMSLICNSMNDEAMADILSGLVATPIGIFLLNI